jgi:hypothetical protein
MAATTEVTMKKSPQQIVNERFGDKAKLIDAVIGLVEAQEGESGDAHKRRLRNVSNAKLLHLLVIAERAKELGGRDGIIKKILELKGQPKDHEYGDRLRRMTLGRVVDMLASLQRAAKRAAPAKAAPAKKTAKKKTAAKKTAKAAARA